MNNQKNKNRERIDLSQFPISRQEEVARPGFSLENLKKFWQKMGKKNQIFTVIIATALILIIVLLISLFSGREGKEIAPGKTIFPEYAPPAEYPAGEEYTPPFP
ncbi:MAG: hypothetical protein QME57_02890 [Patescibacteria group bacterium]|nr:hypothetical protein [Patescibacteria group bacterium]